MLLTHLPIKVSIGENKPLWEPINNICYVFSCFQSILLNANIDKMSSFLHNILDNYLYYKNWIVQTFAIAKELKPVKDFRRIKTIIIRLGFNHKKSHKPIRNGAFSLLCDLVRILTLNLHSRNVVLYTVELRSQLTIQ